MRCTSFENMKNLATLYFFGKISPAPGTVGSLIGMVAGLFLVYFASISFFLFFLIILFLISYFSVKSYIVNQYKSEHDPKEVIIDEFLGQLISMIPIFYFVTNLYLTLIYAFISLLLFRFFDIIKPWPIIYFDQIETPLGVVLDDVIAGIISALLLYIILYIGLI